MGGGLAGSTLAAALARAGRKVLVLERETQFKDRVRGENMVPWGVAAARRLGLVDDLVAAGGHQPPNWIIYVFGNPVMNRDLHATTPHGEVSLNMYHPSMQEALLERARSSGVEVKRGAKVVGVDSGPGPGSFCNLRARRQPANAECTISGWSGRTIFAGSWMGRI